MIRVKVQEFILKNIDVDNLCIFKIKIKLNIILHGQILLITNTNQNYNFQRIYHKLLKYSFLDKIIVILIKIAFIVEMNAHWEVILINLSKNVLNDKIFITQN